MVIFQHGDCEVLTSLLDCLFTSCQSADKESIRSDAYSINLHIFLTSPSLTSLSTDLPTVCRFLGKYVSGIYGTCSIITRVTKNKGRQFLDMVTMSDIAYTVAVIENSYKAWDAEHEEKEKGGEEDSVIAEGDQRQWKIVVKSKFTGQGGKKQECNKSGWSNEGIEFYKRVIECWCELSEESEYNTWTILQEACATYTEKNQLLSFKQKEEEYPRRNRSELQ